MKKYIEKHIENWKMFPVLIAVETLCMGMTFGVAIYHLMNWLGL